MEHLCMVCEASHPIRRHHVCLSSACPCTPADVELDLFGEPVAPAPKADGIDPATGWPVGMEPFDVGERQRQEWIA